jgi:carnosine N-methyltransferase
VSIPDVVIGVRDDNRLPDDFSMAAGDFKSIYGHPREASKWDSVVCCFFLDASPNIVECIQIIHQMLKVGGVLVNFGPLLYHWSGPAMRPDDGSTEEYQSRFAHLDRRYMESVDLSWEDVREVLINVGFDIVEETVGVNALYTADRRSMMNVAYRCIHFVARKRP